MGKRVCAVPRHLQLAISSLDGVLPNVQARLLVGFSPSRPTLSLLVFGHLKSQSQGWHTSWQWSWP